MATLADAPAGALTVEARDLKLTYLRSGAGQPTLFLHAVGSSSADWELVVPLVDSRLDAIVLNLPGFGGSQRPERKFYVEDFADVLLGFVDALGLTQVDLVGTHTGSMVAFHLATIAPDRVRRLALIDLPAWNAAEGQIVFERYFLPQHQARWAKEAEEDASGDGHDRDAERRFWRWTELCQQGNTSYDLDSRAGLVSVPTLIAYGEGSILRRREHRINQGIRGSELVIIPGSTGSAAVEQPQQVARLLLEFLG